MKNEKLLQALGQVKEEFIEEAAPMTTGKETEKAIPVAEGAETQGKRTKDGKSSYRWVKWAALAACAALVIGIGAPQVFRTINDDKRSFWTEGGDYAFALTDDMVTALASTDADYSMDTSLVGDEGFPDWGLTLSVRDVTSTGLTLVGRKEGGNSTGLLRCGTDYRLIVLKDGIWKDVPTVIEEYGWNTLAYNFPEGQATEFECSWEWLYGKLPAGTYRLTKGFMDFREAGDYDTAMYWVEFEIKE